MRIARALVLRMGLARSACEDEHRGGPEEETEEEEEEEEYEDARSHLVLQLSCLCVLSALGRACGRTG